MSKFNVKFVVINEVPTSQDLADRLSIDMSRKFSADGWELISTTVISSGGKNGLLLAFQTALGE